MFQVNALHLHMPLLYSNDCTVLGIVIWKDIRNVVFTNLLVLKIVIVLLQALEVL
jgi:hypothetical protein